MTSIQHLSVIHKQDVWETPPDVFCRGVDLAGFKPLVDYAASKENRKCLEFFDESIDALKHEWVKDGFLNWPYSKSYEFLQHAYEQHLKNNINLLGLGYNKSDTKWYHEFAYGKAEIIPIKGRIKFLQNGKPSVNSAPYPSCWFIWRKK